MALARDWRSQLAAPLRRIVGRLAPAFSGYEETMLAPAILDCQLRGIEPTAATIRPFMDRWGCCQLPVLLDTIEHRIGRGLVLGPPVIAINANALVAEIAPSYERWKAAIMAGEHAPQPNGTGYTIELTQIGGER